MENVPLEFDRSEQEGVVLTDNQARMLGCLACISNCGESYITEANRRITNCTGISRTSMHHSLKRLGHEELIDVRARTTKPLPGIIGPSQTEHTITAAGVAALAPDWKACRDQSIQNSPFAHLTKQQQSLLRCISCLLEQGKEPLTKEIAICNNKANDTTKHMLDDIAKKGFLQKSSAVNAVRQRGGRAPTQYLPTPEAKAHMPAATSILDCRLFNQRADRLYGTLTENQRQVLGCLACLQAKVRRSEVGSVEIPRIATCIGLPLRTINNTTERFAELGVLETKRGYNQNGRRTTYEPTTLGQALFAITTTAATCRTEFADGVRQKPVRIEEAIVRCLGCIWTKQIASEELPGASTAMLKHCTGLPLKTVQSSVAGLAKAGRLKRSMSPVDSMRGIKSPTATYGPVRYLRALAGAGKDCTLPLYLDVPKNDILPLAATTWPRPRRIEEQLQHRDDAVNTWISIRSKHTLLTREEEHRLGSIIQKSTNPQEIEEAIDTFITHNFRLALWAVSRATIARLILPLEDAVQAALDGVQVAAYKFDPSEGNKFSTYAAWWMRQRINREASRYGGIPSHDFSLIPGAFHAIKGFEGAFKRMPSLVELARELNLTPERVNRVIERYAQAVHAKEMHIDHSSNDSENGRTFHEVIGNEDANLALVETKATFAELEQHLNDMERNILVDIISGKKYSLHEIARGYNVSHSKVWDASKRVASLLRHPYFGIAGTLDGSLSWQEDALCRAKGFSRVIERYRGPAPGQAKQLCSHCPVKKKCHELASNFPPAAGIWAGQSAPSYAN